MIDNFALGLTHGLLLLVAWRLLSRPDLDDDEAAVPAPVRKNRRWTLGKGDGDA
ncbi:MAG TPA: hypothetical protein VFZ91_07175 [Allosphingosinicella sp.]